MAEAAPKTQTPATGSATRAKQPAGRDVRWGESSDPEVHKTLAEIGSLEQNRKTFALPDNNDEALAEIDAEIEARYRLLNNLNKPESTDAKLTGKDSTEK